MSDKFDISLYDEDFFLWHKIHAREYSIRNMDWYIEKFKPFSVVDFGCGIGSYLESCFNHEIPFGGIEISEHALTYMPAVVQMCVDISDCTEDFGQIGRFHTVLSFETAEHIEPSSTNQFILNLVNATGKRLLFTAAPPGQEGTGHINCRPKQFWIDEFSKHLTYKPELSDEIAAIWGLQGAPWYIVNNLIVFER